MSKQPARFPSRIARSLAVLTFSALALQQGLGSNQVQVDFDAGGGVYPFFSNSGGTASDGLTLRIGTFNSATDAEVQALGYNLLWVNNQFSLMAPGTGSTATSNFNSQSGSFSSDGSNDAFWTTSDASALNEQVWLVYSDSATLTSSTAFGAASSTNAAWDMPSAYSGTTTKGLNTSQINVTAFGTTSGSGSTGTVRTADKPTGLFWDAEHAGAGGNGTWSATSTVWGTASSGTSDAGQYAWGTTSGTSFYAGAGLTANFGGTAGTVTISGTVQAHNGLNFDPATGTTYTLGSGTVNLAGSSAAANTITAASGDTAIIGSALTGTNGLTKNGTGTVRLDGNNSGLSGNITVNAGTLQANAADAVALSGSHRTTVNTGGSLLISQNNAVSGNITLAGGTVAMSGSGISDAVGALTLSSNSVIDLANSSGARTLTFADSSLMSWTGTLSIWNWNGTNQYGTSYGSGDRQVFFGNSAGGLSGSQLNSISFYSDAGSSFIGSAFIRSSGEIAAIPEPGVYATAALLLAGLGIHHYRRRRSASLAAR